MNPNVRRDVVAGVRACRLWGSASENAVETLAAGAEIVEVDRGTRLVSEGEPAARLGVLVNGQARVYHLGADGREITFETLGAGDPFAAVSALAGGRHPASVDATTPALVAWISREAVYEMLAAEPSVARDIVADLARRVVAFTAVATAFSLDVPQRLARYLFQRSLEGGAPTGQGLLIDLGMSKAQLATALGTVPETLSRALARLKRDGLIEVRARQVIVLDVGALARLSEGYEEG